MAKVSKDYGLDVLHVHYAVPHATAAILACSARTRFGKRVDDISFF
jgi:hypothetical protein